MFISQSTKRIDDCGHVQGDGAEAMAHHVAADRSRQREHEALLLIGGHYMCRLCAYKTTLKANFQLHCKTDKHLQRLQVRSPFTGLGRSGGQVRQVSITSSNNAVRLMGKSDSRAEMKSNVASFLFAIGQHATHIQEGGAKNDWKLQYVTSTTNPIQLRCNVCEYYTNSVHKLQVHAASPRHEMAVALFRHLSSGGGVGVSYQCRLCQFECPNKLTMMQHARSLRHCQLEQLAELQRRSVKEMAPPLDLRDVFVVVVAGAVAPAPTPPADSSSASDADAENGVEQQPTNGTGQFVFRFLSVFFLLRTRGVFAILV